MQIRMNATWIGLAAIALLLLGGCQIDYRETLQLQDDGLWQRVQVIGSTFDAQFPGEATGKQFAVGEKRTGTLTEPEQNDVSVQVPATLGTQPSWQHLQSPLGEAHVLVESRGGAVPVSSDLEALVELVDVVCEDAAVFFETQSSRARWGVRLAALLRGDVRHDLGDVATIAWGCAYAYSFLDTDVLKSNRVSDAKLKEALAQVEDELQRRLWSALAAFLVERDWLSSEAGAVMATNGPDMSIDPDSGINATGGAVAASILAHLRSRLGGMSEDEFWSIALSIPQSKWSAWGDDLMAKVRASLDGKPYLRAAAEPLTELLTSRDLETTLQVGDRGVPTVTNGTWNANRRAVEWTLDASPFAPGLARAPVLWTAAWVKPDTAAQSRALRGVVLEGADLLGFIATWQAASNATRSELLRRMDNGEFKGMDDPSDSLVEALVAYPNPAAVVPR